jgi:hypothetical protein
MALPPPVLGHGAACFQIIVEIVVKAKLVPVSHCLQDSSLRNEQLQRQAADRHETFGSNNCRRAYEASGSADEDGSALFGSPSVQVSSSDQTGSHTLSLVNELAEFAYAAAESAAAAVKKVLLRLQFEGVVCPGTTCDPGSSAELRGLQGKS